MAAVPKDYDLLATLETKITAAKKAVAAEETKAAAYAADEAALEKMRQDVTAELQAAESAAAAVSGASAAAKWGEAKEIASRLAALPQSVEDLRALWAKQGHPSDARAEARKARAAARAALEAQEQSELDEAVYDECNGSGNPGKVKGMLDRGADPNGYKVRRT